MAKIRKASRQISSKSPAENFDIPTPRRNWKILKPRPAIVLKLER